MTEQQIQKKRINQLEAEGYYVLKLIKTNKNGIPDVVAMHPEKGVIFSEIKTPSGKLSKIQEYRLKEIRTYGFEAEVYRGE
jgi:Holliday junction resolvase